MEPLRIHLLGGFLLERGDRPLPPLPSRAARSLLAYLAVNRDRSHTRDLLVGLFWPDMTEARARRRLSHTLWQIQSVLSEALEGEAYVLATPDSVRFNMQAPYWLDVEEFERGVTAADAGSPGELERLRASVALYRGDFLAGVYDEWGLVDQERFRDMHVRALDRIVQLSKAAPDHEQALVYARRLALYEPLREEAHREVMRLCFLLGRPNEAIQAYDRCVAILDEELGTVTEAETDALYREILDLREKGARPFTPAPQAPLLGQTKPVPFVGRADERFVIVSRMEDTLRDRGGVVLIDGETGVGKSRLLRELSEDAHWRGLGVLWGECREYGGRPYEPLRSALDGGLSALRVGQLAQSVDPVWLREAGRVVPRLSDLLPDLPATGRLHAEEEPTRMREALAQVIGAFGRITPHLLVLEDFQWVDEDTARAVLHLADRLADVPVLMMISFRSEEIRGRPEVWDIIRQVDLAPSADRLALAPLTFEQTSELVRRSMGWGATDVELSANLHEETGGNPLFILETLRALSEARADDIKAPVGDLPMTIRVSDVIGRRIGVLDATVRGVLDWVAVAATMPASPDPVLAAAGGPSSLDELAAFDEASRRGLLVDEDGVYRFGHDLFRRHVYESIDPARRRAMHGAVARAVLHSRPDDVEALAHHFAEAGERVEAVEYLALAARRAVEMFAYETAARHFALAGTLAAGIEVAPRTRFDLLAEREKVLDVLGRRDEQRGVIDDMESLSAVLVDLVAETCRRRAWWCAHTGDFEEAAAMARRALDLDATAAGRGASLTALGMTLSWAGQAADAVPHLRAAVDAYAGDARLQAEAQYALGSVLIDLQRYDEAQQELEAALGEYERLQDRRSQAEALGVLGTIHIERGNAAAAEACFRSALDAAIRTGYRHGEAVRPRESG